MRTHITQTMLLLTVMILGAFHTAAPTNASGCDNANAPSFAKGDVLLVNPGQTQNVREAPTTNSRIKASVPQGEYVTVWDGPECADGYSWWRVAYGHQVGWTAEAPSDGSSAWLSKVEMKVYEAGNVRLSVPETLITGFSFVDEPKSGGDGFDTPAHREFTLIDFPLRPGRPDFYEDLPELSIFVRTQADRDADSSPDGLMQDLIAHTPIAGDLVMFDTNPDISRLLAYFDFASGRGRRMLNYDLQSVGFGPIAPDLRYGYSGITRDSIYKIGVRLPIEINWTPPAFPADIPVDGEGVDYHPFKQEYYDYLTAVNQALLDLPPEAFSPRMALIDAMMRSIEITGKIELHFDQP